MRIAIPVLLLRRALLIGPVLLIGLTLAPLANAGSADDDEAVRDPRKIIFEGAKSFDADQLRKRLSLDIDIQVAGHPKNPLPNYLKQIEEVLVAGYRASGFSEASASARFDPRQRRVIVRVHEGPRYRCSRVQVKGLDHLESAAIVAALTQEVPPAFAVPIVVARDDGTTQTDWETVTGSPAKLVEPVWPVGEPVSFDKSLVASAEKALKQWFWDRGRAFARYHAEVKIDQGSEAAILVVTIDDPGVEMTIGEIEIKGAKDNDPSDVLNFLAIRPGMTFDGRLELQLERRLWESGRFISAVIKSSKLERTEHGALIDLNVVVSEHPKAVPLKTPLEPYQQALLKLRDWVVQWTEGIHDEDLVFDAQVDSSIFDKEDSKSHENPKSPAKLYRLHVVTSPGKGQVISMQIKQQDNPVFAQTFIARDRRAIFHSPLTATHLELEHSTTTQLLSRFTMTASKPASPKQLGIGMNFGFGVRSISSENVTPFSLKIELAPLAVLLEGNGLAGAEFKSDAGILTIRMSGAEMQIDEKTGRLVQLQGNLQELVKIRCQTAHGALQREFDRQDRLMARSSNVYDAKRPETSLAVYSIGEYRRICRDYLSSDQQESLAALQKLCGHWSIEPLGDVFNTFDDLDWSPDAFKLPTKQIRWAHPALSLFDGNGSGTLAGYLLPVYREIVPRTGWLWPLGRDSLFALIGRPIGTSEDIGQYRQVVESGPLGHLTSALALASFSPPVSQQLARHAMKRLSAKSFRADYAPLLEGDSWLGRNILSLAEALRRLDDSEIEALARLLPDQTHHRQIVDSLRILKDDSRKPIRDVLPIVYERLWLSTLKPPVESALETLAASKSLESPPLIRDAKIERTSGSK